ncbi:preprotein translocase subunit SecA [Bowdeniella nasicola]|uniref:Protein translocase subunit SecA n=1 Tax=Bowdeniella nasicola TaxID=208480 RepID=A0A1H3VMY0_9ACTO|nr:preprotein translocase subunit SecA [Bowdeniella nasicola]SDZ76130.1 preprotein translocase subunit SecA [Bowdeniella nasicola]
MASILDRILRFGEGRVLRNLASIAAQVNKLEPTVEDLSDEELRAETDEFRKRLSEGETLDDILPEAFAVVREAAKRTLGQRPYDVQIQGGAALHMGNIAEMQTGEGKTLVATMPAYLNALEGKGVHVVTVNDYLASYQSELMGRVFRFLGLTTGCIIDGQTPAERRVEYAADITYGTNNQFGFDYLRDNMAWSPEEMVQRGHNFAIVDEVDSILIDEARTPLIISGPASGDVNSWYTEFATIVARLKPGTDYEVDEKKRTIGILEPGIAKVEDHLGIDNLYESSNTPLIGFLNNAIKAKELFKRDKDYIVAGGEVLIVDEHTGRTLHGRRYNEGMHQAIEAKEGVEIKAENQTLATITLQNYFRLYDKLAGMTGTAETEAAEFMNTYEIGVIPIATNKPNQRTDQADLVYKNQAGKWNAVVEDIVERHATGQPVLVGTTNVEKSEMLSKMLKKRRVPHTVLNAKQHEREGHVIAMAGRKGAVTVATNMAGRGTDIMLGGNAEHIAIENLKAAGLDPTETPEEYEAAWPKALEDAKDAVAAEHDEVTELGGLYVLGTERHDARRIDNQLRGRSGRQGDPGESRFYLAMDDDIMRRFASGAAQRIMSSDAYPEDMPLESKIVTRAIASAQRQVESQNAETRKNVLKYDDIMNQQRTIVYDRRHKLIMGEDVSELVDQFRHDVISGIVRAYTLHGTGESWDLDEMFETLNRVYHVTITKDDLIEDAGDVNRLTQEGLIRELTSDIDVAYAEREEEIGEEMMRDLERRVVMTVLDQKWREHLYEMDYLKEGIGLRAMAQRDPLVEYRKEGYDLFQSMEEAIKEDVVRYLFFLQVQQPGEAEAAGQQSPEPQPAPEAAPAKAKKASPLALKTPERPSALTYSASARDGSGQSEASAPSGQGAAFGLDEGTAAPQGGNRAERRAAKKARRKRGR